MSGRARRFASLVLLGLAGALAVVPTAAAQDERPEPSIALSTATVAFGDDVIVNGTGWPANAFVHVEICGNRGTRATLDCDQVTAQQSGVSTAGTFGVVLLVGNPPTPCPCIVRVSSISTDATVTAPLDIDGAPIADGDPTPLDLPERLLVVTDVDASSPGGWRAWLGLGGETNVTVTVKNVGRARVDDPLLQLRFGDGDDPQQQLLERPGLGAIAPGETATFDVRIDTPFATIGTHTIEGRFQGLDDPAYFRAETVHLPWLLLLIPVLVALLATGVIVRRLTRRSLRHGLTTAPSPPALSPAVPIQQPEPVAVPPLASVATEPDPPIEPEPEPEPEPESVTEPEREPEPEPEPDPVVIDLTMPELVLSDLDLLIGHQVAQAKDPMQHAGTQLRRARERRAVSAELAAAAVTRVASTMRMDPTQRARLSARVDETLRSERPLSRN